MDIRQLSFDAEEFDIALDKGWLNSVIHIDPTFILDLGTMDAMMTGVKDVWVGFKFCRSRQSLDLPSRILLIQSSMTVMLKCLKFFGRPSIDLTWEFFVQR